jgi:hypothetical protein
MLISESLPVHHNQIKIYYLIKNYVVPVLSNWLVSIRYTSSIIKEFGTNWQHFKDICSVIPTASHLQCEL